MVEENSQQWPYPPYAILNYGEVAAITGRPESTHRYLRMKGEGPRSFKLGRAVRFKAQDVYDWIEAQRAQGVGYAASEGEAS